MSDIKLYGYSTSPYVRKVGCFLYYKQLDFEFIPVNPIQPDAIGFSEQTQVPVLSIGGEWRKDSTPLGIWLDECFPERPLLGIDAGEKTSILSIDSWITKSFITAGFRSIAEAEVDLPFRSRAWRLAAILSAQTPLPDKIRDMWPQVLKTAPFIKEMVKQLDLTEPLADLQLRLMQEMVAHIGDGPFIGGRSEPSLADFALYPQLVFGYATGMEAKVAAAAHPQIKQWLKNVAEVLPANPLLVPDHILVNQLDFS